MSFVDELRTQFEFLNVQTDEAILLKCAELCVTYNLPPEDFVDQWIAYTTTNLNGAPPSLDVLDTLERKELKKMTVTTPQVDRQEKISTPKSTPIRKNLIESFMESPKPMEVDLNSSLGLPSQSFLNQVESGSNMVTFGECNSQSFKSNFVTLTVKNLLQIELRRRRYMFNTPLLVREAVDKRMKTVVGEILNFYNLQLTPKQLSELSGETTIAGSVVTELDGSLDFAKVQIQGLIDIFNGNLIKVDMSQIERLKLFPGQTVVINGINMQDYVQAKQVYTGAPIKNLSLLADFDETIQIMVAASPFTLQENLLFEPLDQLLKKVVEEKPNVLVLMGPFLEFDHPQVKNLNESFGAVFENLIEKIMLKVKQTTHVIIVPSHNDIFNCMTFPTWPFSLKKRYKNLHLVTDPFFVDINGLVISGCTVDVAYHLGRVERTKGFYTDRISHLISHLFSQRNFYPLYPPSSDLLIDHILCQSFGVIKDAPHIMVLPSKFRHFVKVVNNCVVVNPEKLIKEGVGGFYAKIEVRAEPKNVDLHERISCVIQCI